MTPVFCCGFECGVSGAHWTLSAGGSFDTTIKRSGARSFKITSGVSTTVSGTFALSGNIFVVRFYLYLSALPSVQGNSICLLRSGSSTRGGVSVSTTGEVIAKAGGFDAASGVFIQPESWNCIDYKLDISNNPWTGDIKVNGRAGAQATNAVAGNTATSMSIIDNGVFQGGDVYIDDLVISQTSGDYPIGAGYVNHFIPTSDGTHNVAGTGDFQRTLTGTDILNATTTAFQLVDDVPLESGASVDWINLLAPPNATDYVECVFGAASGIRTPLVAPRAVEVIAGIHQAGATAGNMEIRINDNGTTNAMYTATAVVGTTTVIYKRKCYAANIANGGAWTVVSGAGNFNNLRMRFGSPAAVDANPDQYLDCIMVEAEFKEILFNSIQVKQAVNRAGTY